MKKWYRISYNAISYHGHSIVMRHNPYETQKFMVIIRWEGKNNKRVFYPNMNKFWKHISVWKWLKIIVSISILMSCQKIYVLFIVQKPIQYRICQIVIFKIWWKIYMELENWNCQYERLQKGWLYTGWFITRHPDRWGGSLKKLQHKYVNVNDSINEV